MKDYSPVLYRRAPEVSGKKPDGASLAGRGLVAGLKGLGGDFAQGISPLGEVAKPLFVFTGWLPGAGPGDRLEQGGVSYRVLKTEELAVGGAKLCLRAVMEKEEEDAGQ